MILPVSLSLFFEMDFLSCTILANLNALLQIAWHSVALFDLDLSVYEVDFRFAFVIRGESRAGLTFGFEDVHRTDEKVGALKV